VSDAERRQRSRQAEDPEERAGALREALRSGEVSRDRLLLAAYLGDEVAQAVAGPQGVEVPAGVHEWFAGIRHLDSWAWLRAIGSLIRPRLREAAAEEPPAAAPSRPGDLADHLVERLIANQRSQVAGLRRAERLCRDVLWPLLERPSAAGQRALVQALEGLPREELPHKPAGLRQLLLLVAHCEDLSVENWHREHLVRFSELWVGEGATLEVGSFPYPDPDDELYPEEIAANLDYYERYSQVQARLEGELRQLVRADAARWLLPV